MLNDTKSRMDSLQGQITEIRKAVSRWTFTKVKSGNAVVYVPIRFYEEDKTSSQTK